jgi:hypothetical protein
MVKNESDIIESFVRRHIDMVDAMLIVNHNSVDSTGKILELLKEEGLNLFISNEKIVEYEQSRIMTNLLYKAINEFNADIVIPLDADEFLVPSNDVNDCRQLLETIDTNSVYRIDSFNYFQPHAVPVPVAFSLDDVKLKSRTRQKMGKIIIGRDIVTKFNVGLAMGNHDVAISRRKRKHVNFINFDKIHIAHCQIRSEEQFLSKIAVNYLLDLSRTERDPRDSYHIKNIFEKIKTGEHIDYKEMLTLISGIDNILNKENIDQVDICSKIHPINLKYAEYVNVDKNINLITAFESITIEFSKLKRSERLFAYPFNLLIKNIIRIIKFIWFRRLLGRTVST